MEIIDLNTWDRATHFNFFRRMDYPQYLICSNVDVTHFLARVREQKTSFYYAMIYAAMRALNQVKEFQYRIHGDQVVWHPTIHPSFTDIAEGSELFKIVTVDMEADIEAFVARAKAKSEGQTDYFVREDVEGRDDLAYITCIPWISFTNLSHTISFNKDDSVPRLAWGKYFEENHKTLLPFSVQAHHSFVDGIHMGKYYDQLQKYLDTF
ncbi:MAG: chloramphenicol acetyltransferase [Anaerolineaceae bacterium]|nr:chloramphenicol acetyltransferase [Anaerolineaceae bacterium]